MMHDRLRIASRSSLRALFALLFTGTAELLALQCANRRRGHSGARQTVAPADDGRAARRAPHGSDTPLP